MNFHLGLTQTLDCRSVNMSLNWTRTELLYFYSC